MVSASEPKAVDKENAPAIGTAKWTAPNERRLNRVLDTTMRVTTPENIAFNYQVVGPFRRVFAYGLDLLIAVGGYAVFIVLIYLLLTFVLIPVAGSIGGTGLIEAVVGVLQGFISIGFFIVYWFYGAYFETNWNGQTLGKRIMKMRVISTDGSAIDGVQAILRNFFRFLDSMPFAPWAAMFQLEQQVFQLPPTCLIGLVLMMLTKNFQRVGDLVAGTVVISEEQKRPPNLATFTDERVPLLAELIPTSFVVPATMARAIADYVDQRKFLPFQRASEIASHLAVPLMDKFGIQQDTDHDLFLCALYYKQFVSSQAVDGYDTQASTIVPAGKVSAPKNVTPSTMAELASNDTVTKKSNSENSNDFDADDFDSSAFGPNANDSSTDDSTQVDSE